MQIYFASCSLEEGFSILEEHEKGSRVLRGKQVSRPSGWALFHSLKGQPIRCHFCGCEADRWVSVKGRKNKVGGPVLDLYATSNDGRVVLMTRDHIIPKSLGGKDCVENLRPACGPCNEDRSNEVTEEVIQFAKDHPELIDPHRIKQGLESLQRHVKTLKVTVKNAEAEIARMQKPFKDMGYL